MRKSKYHGSLPPDDAIYTGAPDFARVAGEPVGAQDMGAGARVKRCCAASDETLAEEKKTDVLLTQIAETAVNQDAEAA